MSDEKVPEGKVAIRHERVAGYRTEFITGGSVAGPLQDGFFRMTLFRDAIPPLTEIFDALPDDPDSVDMSKSKPVKVQLFREDVFTLVLPPEIALKMGQDLIERANSVLTKA
ncbi:hypothetical protein MKP15_04355 [Stenotrophomonas sp. Y6]|uniref:hypothetical protein n=1 Tax=Stenotrophomonas sp. Y6 TaxID=2920383 RepID=UPI001F06C6F4|nr:hypothetical protein [Stenotrophomonas sp. Y6]MCH1908005.1 hypothetical protein [Stenotrophomonas sp. Y6]